MTNVRYYHVLFLIPTAVYPLLTCCNHVFGIWSKTGLHIAWSVGELNPRCRAEMTRSVQWAASLLWQVPHLWNSLTQDEIKAAVSLLGPVPTMISCSHGRAQGGRQTNISTTCQCLSPCVITKATEFMVAFSITPSFFPSVIAQFAHSLQHSSCIQKRCLCVCLFTCGACTCTSWRKVMMMVRQWDCK